ncbi:hypothetical protein D3C84_997490 [compost metagenome]
MALSTAKLMKAEQVINMKRASAWVRFETSINACLMPSAFEVQPYSEEKALLKAG